MRMFGSRGFLVVIMAVLFLLGAPALAGTHFEHTFEQGPGGQLVLDSAIGSVKLVGTSTSVVRVVFDSSKDLEENYSFDFAQEGSTVRITVKKTGSSWRFWKSFSSGRALFEIEVPTETRVDVDTAGGSIRIADIVGEVRADTSGGGIILDNIEGVALADTSGGSIKASRIHGPLNADTSGGGIHVDGITGDLLADTSGGGIHVKQAGATVNADTSGGSITVSFVAGNSRGGTLSTSGGGITVKVDPQVGLMIDAATSGGSVRTELELLVKGKNSRNSLHGKLNGGGELLRLRTSGGSIRIQPL